MNCRSCGESNSFVDILDLDKQAWCNNFLNKDELGDEDKYPLKLIYCKKCDMLQLSHTVSKNIMFKQHDYLSGTTKTLREHFYSIAKENIDTFGLSGNDCILDIGGNDGTQLAQYKLQGLNNVINVESADNIAKISTDAGIPTINAFFNEELVYKRFLPGSIMLVNASGVFFHLEELHSVIRAIKYVLSKTGVFIVQFMYAGMMIEKGTYDMIYHEHLLYYTLHSLKNLLEHYGLGIFDAYESDIHSGSIIAKICHIGSYDLKRQELIKTERLITLEEKDSKYTLERFKEFGKNITSNRYKLRDYLLKLKKDGKKIYGYAAPAKGNTLLTYENINNKILDKIAEVNPLKIGKYTPITHIPIVQESKEDLPDYYLLLNHNFCSEILEKNPGVSFVHPFPPHIIKKEV